MNTLRKSGLQLKLDRKRNKKPSSIKFSKELGIKKHLIRLGKRNQAKKSDEDKLTKKINKKENELLECENRCYPAKLPVENLVWSKNASPDDINWSLLVFPLFLRTAWFPSVMLNKEKIRPIVTEKEEMIEALNVFKEIIDSELCQLRELYEMPGRILEGNFVCSLTSMLELAECGHVQFLWDLNKIQNKEKMYSERVITKFNKDFIEKKEKEAEKEVIVGISSRDNQVFENFEKLVEEKRNEKKYVNTKNTWSKSKKIFKETFGIKSWEPFAEDSAWKEKSFTLISNPWENSPKKMTDEDNFGWGETTNDINVIFPGVSKKECWGKKIWVGEEETGVW